jgi:serine/threonine-protein kinase HipA
MNVPSSPGALAVWVDSCRAGLLDRSQDQRQYIFSYSHESEFPRSQVSLTMPVRLESWLSRELHPVFQMNLPEGALREAIRRAISKLAGDDDLTILRVTGGNQIGLNRYSLPGDPFPGVIETRESLNDLLSYPDTVELFQNLMDKYALKSGVSGVQPKVILEAFNRVTTAKSGFIVKSWGSDYPHLAANEFFCMTAVKQAGLPVSEFHLSDNGGLFVMKRFDVADDGRSLGFEDMCSLQALGTSQKYNSTYERVAKSITDFVSPEFTHAAREQLFATLVLSGILRNGDAHLKNFGILYDHPGAVVRLAPIYDVVTTVAYIPKDVPALALSGTKKWWSRKLLEQFAIAHLALPTGKISQIINKASEAVAATRKALSEYTKDHPEFRETGNRMLSAWETGLSGLQ